MEKFRTQALVGALALAFPASAALAAASCSYTNFSIGYEISAIQGPSNGQYLFAVSPLRCNASGTVIYDGGTGFSDGYEMGWYTPAAIRSALQSSFLLNMKSFEGLCRLHYIGINSRYRGTVDGINALNYAVQPTPYLGVFKTELHLPLGDTPRLYRRDAIASQSDNTCSIPLQNKPQQCSGLGNPILPGQGCKVQKETDYTAGGISPLELVRYYDSQNPYHALSALPRPLGNRWRHNYEVSLNPAAGTNLVLMLRDDGKIIHFTPKPGNTTLWIGDADTVGQLTKEANGWSYRDEDDALETFDSQGKRLTRVGRDGRALNFAYDANERLTDVTDNFARTLHLNYNAAGLLADVSDPSGQRVAYAYDGQGTLIGATYPDTRSRAYGYTSVSVGSRVEPALLTGLTDENSSPYASWTYDASALASSSEHAGAVDRYAMAYQKDGSGRITGATVTNPLNAVTQYSFQTILSAIKPSSISHPLLPGVTRSLTYDTRGNLVSQTDYNGNLTTFTWDLTRNLETSSVEASGTPQARTISTEWHPTFRLPTRIAQPLQRTTLTYDAKGNALTRTEQSTTDANGSAGFTATLTGSPRTWTYTYNAYGQVLTANGPRTDVADVTTYTYYDAADPDLGKRGNLASVSNALGHVTQITAYDLNGNPLTILDANGVASTLTYDLRQRLTSRTLGTEQTAYQYDGVGQLTRITLPDGRYIAYTWDAAHRLTGLSDALGNQILYTLDAIGNRTKEDVRDPANQLARTRQRVYDALSRLAQDIGAQNQITAYAYDANGNRTQVTDAQSHSTVSAYDALNRLIRITDPGAGVTQLAWDGQDRLTGVTDPRNLLTRTTLDGLGNRTQLQSPDSGTTGSTFDAAGNELTRTDAKGQLTRTAFDALNRPTLITYADGTQLRATWDQGANGKGRLTQLEELTGGSVTGSQAYTYDALGRRLSETRTIGSLTHTQSFTWSNGQLSSQTLPSGRQLTYARNAAGQISQITLTDIAPNAGQSKVIASAIAWHPFGGIKRWTDGAGQVHTRNQDQDGRPSGFTLGSTPWLLSYDSASRITGQIDGGNAANSALYGYDALDRLSSAQLPASTYGYAYDATGNRSSQTLGGTTRAYLTDPASNRLQSVAGSPPKTYTTDANGSITGDGQNQWAYDSRGRLASVTTAAGTTTYRINALGQRVRKTTAGGTPGDTLYHYDLAGHLIAESDGTGQIQREYLWLEDTPLAVLQ